MAKGNLFLGTARKKLGDVVLYRRQGEQQSRVRVRSIANPKTEGQALQRNYLAPVSKFYAPLAAVLERSWEGLNKVESHQAFLKANIDLARKQGWYVPKGTEFTPLPYKVSKGTLNGIDYGVSDGVATLYIPGAALTSNSTIADLSQRLIGAGAAEGDQVTIIAALFEYGDYRPTWLRFWLDTEDDTLLSNVTNGAIYLGFQANHVIVRSSDDNVEACAVIMSRFQNGSWLRSTAFMAVSETTMADYTGSAARARAIQSYQAASSIVSSSVYLNGSDVDNGGNSRVQTAVTISNSQGVVGEAIVVQVGRAFSSEGPEVTSIIGRMVNDGSIVVFRVKNNITGSAGLGKYLSPNDTWVTLTGTDFMFTEVSSSDDAIATLLVSKYGYDAADFQ
jgi:hypothetical protein